MNQVLCLFPPFKPTFQTGLDKVSAFREKSLSSCSLFLNGLIFFSVVIGGVFLTGLQENGSVHEESHWCLTIPCQSVPICHN